MSWVVGHRERIERRWVVDGVAVTTGSASVQVYSVAVDGSKLYLQSDGSVSSVLANIPLTRNANDWFVDITVPSEFSGTTAYAVAFHSTLPDFPLDEDHEVTTLDFDDFSGELSQLSTSVDNLSQQISSLAAKEGTNRPVARHGGL